MGVYTDADRFKDGTLESICAAKECILEFLKPDTFGTDNYSEDYIEKMAYVLLELIKIESKLK